MVRLFIWFVHLFSCSYSSVGSVVQFCGSFSLYSSTVSGSIACIRPALLSSLLTSK